MAIWELRNKSCFEFTKDLEIEMTNSNRVSAQDISAKWAKVSQTEAAAIKNVDGLSAQVAKSYNLDKAKADAEVKEFMGARTF
jgi:hypothetical protein